MWRVCRRPRDLDVRGRADRDRRRIARRCGSRCAVRSLRSSARACSRSTAARSSAASKRFRRSSRVGYDRAFPHTLRLTLVPETPVAVLHRGTGDLAHLRRAVASWFPSGLRTYPALPRIWVPHATDVAVGELRRSRAARETPPARSHSPSGARFPARIATAAMTHGGSCFHLRSGRRAPSRRSDRRAPQARRRATRPARTSGRDGVSGCQRAGAGPWPEPNPRLSGRG